MPTYSGKVATAGNLVGSEFVKSFLVRKGGQIFVDRELGKKLEANFNGIKVQFQTSLPFSVSHQDMREGERVAEIENEDFLLFIITLDEKVGGCNVAVRNSDPMQISHDLSDLIGNIGGQWSFVEFLAIDVIKEHRSKLFVRSIIWPIPVELMKTKFPVHISFDLLRYIQPPMTERAKFAVPAFCNKRAIGAAFNEEWIVTRASYSFSWRPESRASGLELERASISFRRLFNSTYYLQRIFFVGIPNSEHVAC